MKFHRIIIVGLGQIGTSLGLSLRRAKLAPIQVGADLSPKNLAVAKRRGAIHLFLKLRYPKDLLKLDLREDDLVCLAVPVESILHYLKVLPRAPLIMDVGSTKRSIVALAIRKRLRYIGAHPVAGIEKSGAEAGDPRLFEGKICFLSGLDGHTADRRFIEQLWKKLGATVRWIDPLRHDQLFARISHLPHAVSFAFVRAVLPLLKGQKIRGWAEGSFRDATRVASSSPQMWTDIFLQNRSPLLPLLSRLIKELSQLKNHLWRGNRSVLQRWISEARQIKDSFQ